MRDNTVGSRNHGRQAAEQRERVEVDGDGAITERTAQLDADQVIGQDVQALLSDGWTEGVTDQGLATPGIVSVGGGCGVQREAEFGYR